MVILYRAISQQEKEDFVSSGLFRTSRNTLEVKQFFKSRIAIKEFVASSITQGYDPPYVCIIIVGLDESDFEKIEHTQMKLDGYEAVNIEEIVLPAFSNYVKFVREEVL